MITLRVSSYWRKLTALWLIAAGGGFALTGALSGDARAAGSADSFSITLGLQDVWPPAPVADLDAAHGEEGKALLFWTAPDENGDGFAEKLPVSGYFIRIATFSIDGLAAGTAAWWDAAGDAAGAPVPLPPGDPQSLLLAGLTPGGTYFFAIRSVDDAGLVSPIDDKAAAAGLQASVAVFDAVPPAPAGLTAAQGNGQVALAWAAVGAPDLWFYSVHVDSTPPYDFGDQFLIAAASGSASYVHTGLTPGATYAYFVTAVDKGAPDFSGYALESPASNSVATMTVRAVYGTLAVAADKLANVWYSTPATSFSAQGAGHYHYMISASSSDLPSEAAPAFDGAALVLNLSDGIWYFNVRGEGPAHDLTGYVSYGPLQIDSLPPVMTELRAQRSAADGEPVLSGVLSDAQIPRFGWDVPAARSPVQGYSYAVSLDSASVPAESVNTAFNFRDYAAAAEGRYYVKVKALGGAGNWSSWTSFTFVYAALPSRTSVVPENNYFNPRKAQQMLVRSDIQRAGRVRIRIFNLRGELIKTLEDGQKAPGQYTVTWGGRNNSGEMVASGVYLVYAEAPGYKRTFKCIVAK